MAYSDSSLELPCTGLTNEASAEDLCQLGLVYSTGLGVAEDYVAAHKWFNLAALRGSDDAKIYRKDLSDSMSSEEIAQAQKAAREWLSLMN